MSGPFPVGEVVGGLYRVEGQLGQGGMGVVYRARQVQTGAGVALKVVTGFGNPEHVARFEREARLAARPEIGEGVVRVFQLGRHRGLPFVAMELIEGQDMSDALKAGMEPQRLARIVETVARTLGRCHRAGVVHRDLKPGNVLLRADDDTPRVADFGLARDLRGDEQQLTKTGQLLGTPAFMAPEQVDEAMNVGPSADIYALGAILYNGLAGQKPWQGPLPQVIRNLLLKDPPLPSTLREGVPPDLEAICRVAMAKEPADRYASAELLAEDLARFLRGEDVLARPLSRFKSLRRRFRRGDPLLRVPFYGALLALIVGGPLFVGLRVVDARERVGRGEVAVGQRRAGLVPASSRAAFESGADEGSGPDLRDLRLSIEQRRGWLGGPWSQDWPDRAERVEAELSALERWEAHCAGEAGELGDRQAGPLSLWVDALVLFDSGEDRKASRRLALLEGEEQVEGHVRRLKFLLGLRALRDTEELRTFLVREVPRLTVSEDAGVVGGFVEGPARRIQRGLVLAASKDLAQLEVLDGFLKVVSPLGILGDDAAARKSKVDWIELGAVRWGRAFKPHLEKSSEDDALQFLAAVKHLLAETSPRLPLDACPTLVEALDAALGRRIEGEVVQRAQGGGAGGGRSGGGSCGSRRACRSFGPQGAPSLRPTSSSCSSGCCSLGQRGRAGSTRSWPSSAA